MNNSIYDTRLSSEAYYPKVVAYYLREWKDYNMSTHSHNQVEIMYVVRGQCVVQALDKTYNMSKGDCIFLDANVPHNLIVEKEYPCKMLNVEFGFESMREEFLSMKTVLNELNTFIYLMEKGPKVIFLKDNEELFQLLKNIIKELEEKNTDNTYMLILYIFQLIMIISRRAKEAEEEEEKPASHYIKKAIKYINENYKTEIQVKDIAQFVNLHVNYFHRIFKAHTGESVMDYIQKMRIKKAEMLLAYTEIPIIDLAGELGFGSRQYFSYIFKRYKGVSPAYYRKEYSKVKWH